MNPGETVETDLLDRVVRCFPPAVRDREAAKIRFLYDLLRHARWRADGIPRGHVEVQMYPVFSRAPEEVLRQLEEWQLLTVAKERVYYRPLARVVTA